MWGGAVTLGALLLSTFGIIEITQEDQQQIAQLVVQVVGIIGAMVSMVGRYRAKTELTIR
jgi:hypothetical protein